MLLFYVRSYKLLNFFAALRWCMTQRNHISFCPVTELFRVNLNNQVVIQDLIAVLLIAKNAPSKGIDCKSGSN